MSSRSRQPANIPYSNFWLVAAEDAVRPQASENRKNYANAVGSKEKRSKRCIMTANWLLRERHVAPSMQRIFDGEKEAKLIALACSKPPKGRARWTLRLLENKVVELGIVDHASDSTIGRTLKKTASNPIAGSAG